MQQQEQQYQQQEQQYQPQQNQEPQSKEEQITHLFLTFVTNLIKKGGSAMIHLLGDFFGVNVENKEPDQLIDEFNARLRDPEMQLKLLQMIQGLVQVVSPALKEAINEAIQIFGDMLAKMGQQAIKVGVDVAETAPIVGEVIAGVKAVFDIARAFIAGTSAMANTATVGFNTASKIKEGLDKPFPQIPEPKFNPEFNLEQQQPEQQQQQPQYLQQGGKKQYQKLKKIQENTLNRISNAVQEFNGTRKANKKRGSKMRMPKMNANSTRSRRNKLSRKLRR